MKILLINKHYYRKGGAETVFFNTKELLEKNGHEVVVFSMKHIDNEESKDEKYFVSFVDITTLRGWYYKMFRFLYNVKASSNLKKLIKAEKPDLAHFHNVYHQLTYSIIKPLKKYKIPIVETLHDYHLISPNYHLYHDGEICERSRDGNYLKSIFHRCIGHSFIKSFAGALNSYLYKIQKISHNIDLFISPSLFLKKKYVEFGFKGEIQVVNNSIELSDYQPNYEPGDYVLFFGRLSVEKGLLDLLKVMTRLPDIKLKIAGSGPQEKELKKFVIVHDMKNIEFTGRLNKRELNNEISNCAFVVVPSVWYENYPMTVIESMAMGKPVLATGIGGLSEMIIKGETGDLVKLGNIQEWESLIKTYFLNKEKLKLMGENARVVVEENNSHDKYYQELLGVYQGLINKKISLG